MDARFLAFVFVSALLIVTPGQDMALVTNNALRRGRPAAAATAWGVGAGVLAWAAATGLGLAALLSASAAGFAFLKLLGAAYLVYLGLRSLRGGIRHPEPLHPREGAGDGSERLSANAFLQGMLGNLLNPKAAVIFLTVLPQFIRPSDPAARILGMLVVFEVMIIGWLHIYGFAIARAGQAFNASGLRRWLKSVTGAALIGLGARLALERR